jgi:5-bromo-4-chloroindolyl phosphate hydrolysis protein
MPTPEDFNPENSRICWPAILVVFAVQMIVLITLSIAVAHHSDFATASSQAVKAGLDVVDKSDMSKRSYKK